MDQQERIAQALASGVAPLELLVQDVYAMRGANPIARRSFVRINSMELGVLDPEQYRVAVSRAGLDARLSQWNLMRVLSLLANGGDAVGKDCVWIVEMPISVLKSDWLLRLLQQQIEAGFSEIGRLCVAFPVEVLLQDRSETAAALDHLRALGVRVAITDFGGEDCPILRLSGLPFDMVLLDRSFASYILREEMAVVKSVLTLVHGLGGQIVLNTTQADVLRKARRYAIDSYMADCYKSISEVSVT